MRFELAGAPVEAGTGGRTWQPDLPALILLHGAGMDHTVWALQARAFAHHGRNVLALDLPAHGSSGGAPLASIAAMAEWAIAAADAAGVTKFRLAGHSMGSLIALEAAARAGARCERLALLGFAPEMRVHPDLIAAARAGSRAAPEMMVNWSLGTPGMLGGNPAPGLYVAGGALQLLERAPKPSLAADLAACEAYRGAAAAAARIAAPSLFVLGAEDRMTPTAAALEFAARLAGAKSVVLPGVGHLMPVEAPGPTLAALREFL